MYYYIKNKIEIVFRKLAELYSRRKLSSNPELWDVLQNYLSKTKSTGCSYIGLLSTLQANPHSPACRSFRMWNWCYNASHSTCSYGE